MVVKTSFPSHSADAGGLFKSESCSGRSGSYVKYLSQDLTPANPERRLHFFLQISSPDPMGTTIESTRGSDMAFSIILFKIPT